MPSARKAMLGLVLSATIALAFVVSGVASGDELLLVIGVLSLILAAFWIRRLLAPTHSLLVAIRNQVRRLAFIEWDNLERLEVFRIHGRFLAFHVHNPEAIRLSASWWERPWRAINRAVEGAPATVSENIIDGRFEDVVPTILRYKDVPVDWRA